MNYYLIIGLLLFLASVLLIILALGYSSNKNIKKAKNKDSVSSFMLYIYRVLNKFFITRKVVRQIRSRVEIVGVLNERVVRKKVVQIFLAMLFVVVSVFALVIVISKSVVTVLISALIVWLFFEILIEVYVTNIKNKLLKDQLRLNELIRHEFFHCNMVDEAIYESCGALTNKEHEIFIQAQKIYDVLTSKDVEKSIIQYNEVAPNKFLKMLLGLCYMTMEYGDTVSDGTSIFMRNLSDLTGEIRLELSKRERINRGLFSLNFICLTPILLLNPIKMWASKYFLPLKMFYDSRTGIILKLLAVVLVFIGFIGVRTIGRFNKNNYEETGQKVLNRIYDKFIGKFVDYIGGLKDRRKYENIKKRLTKVVSSHTPETFMTQKVIMFIVGFIATIVIFISISVHDKHMVKNEPTLPEHFLGGAIDEKQKQLSIQLTDEDNILLEKMDISWTKEMITQLLSTKNMSDEQIQISVERLYTKKEILYKYAITWIEVLYSLALGIVFYFVPDFSLAYRRKIMQVELEDEVSGFDSIIAMLMNHKRLSVIDILEWLEMYSVIFKGAISDCINDYSSGSDDALLKLAKANDNERFLRIVGSLITASDKLSVKEAFYELSQDKQYFLEQRKILNEEIIEKKINAGKMFGFLPVYGLVVLYMVLPMIMVAMNDMNKYFNQLKL